mmetsp:Transcript_3749/g.7270  ORF Transcript_3749/g.7270 Transcript_3749/m.7270 type:complete len:118 (+) Transcript_3749:3-356(+)
MSIGTAAPRPFVCQMGPPCARPRATLAVCIALLLTSAAAAPAEEKKQPSEAELSEYKQDFVDFDVNKDNQIDAQEVRSQFKGDLDPRELHQFFIDVDKDQSGTLTLKEYVDYAATLN